MRSLSLVLVLVLAAAGAAQERVQLTAADGQPLVGTYAAPQGPSRGGLLLLHMYATNRTTWEPLLARLAGRGFHVLALDLRGHGDSALDADGHRVDVRREVASDPAANPFLKMHLDARAGLEYLAGRGAPKERLAIVGASVGCSVALHCAVECPSLVAAVVLFTPGKDYLGVPSLEHAKRYGDRPALILAAEEEADVGARPLKEVLTSNKVELRLYPEKAVHGTRMLGRVATVEADVIQWLETALSQTVVLAVPLTKDVIVDGKLEATEGAQATRVSLALEDGRTAEVRLSRSRTKLLFGFAIPERHLRLNEVTVFIDTRGEGPVAPTPSCWRLSFNPNNPARPALRVARGADGAWKDTADEGVQAYGDVSPKSSWSAELSLSLAQCGIGEGPTTIRLAFQINGQKKDQERYYPATANIKLSPRSWVAAKME